MIVTRNVWMKYHSPTNGDGSDLGGGGGGSDDNGGSDDKGGAGADDKGGTDDKGGDKTQKTGPSDEEARLLKENMQKKEQLRKQAEELAALKKSVEGLDLDSVRKLLAEQKTAEEKQLEARGEWDRLKARMAEEHGNEKKALTEQIAALQAQLNGASGTINELTIGTSFGQSKFISEELVLPASKARVLYGDHFDLEDGKVVGYDKPRGAANRTALVDGSGNPISFDAALRKIVEIDPEKDHLLKSKVKPGAGSDSKKPVGDIGSKGDVNPDAVTKISAGLKGLIK